MREVLFKKGQKANMPQNKTEGTFYVTTDEHALYLDIDANTRIKVAPTSGEVDDIKAKIPAEASADNKLVHQQHLSQYALISESANKLSANINTTDYVMTIQLLDKHDNIIDSKTIDFPLESVVVNGSFDHGSNKIVLTLQNGNVIDIPVGSVINGLASQEWVESHGYSTQAWVSGQGYAHSSQVPTQISQLTDDSEHRTVTDGEKASWSGKLDPHIISHETWTFTMEDGSTITKEVALWTSQ